MRARILLGSLVLSAAALAACQSATPGGVGPSAAASAAADRHVLSGVVLDESLLPISGATVAVTSGGASLTATTDKDGKYALPGVSDGAVTVEASKTGYTTRSRQLTLQADAVCNFGAATLHGRDAYCLSTTPEIASINTEETPDNASRTYVVTFSEPLPPASQESFWTTLGIWTSENKRAFRFPSPPGELTVTKTWEPGGAVLRIAVGGYMLAPGTTDLTYTFKLDQVETTPAGVTTTEERTWQSLKIVDAANNPLGKDRADWAFLQQASGFPSELPTDLLQDKNLANTMDQRVWALTHTGTAVYRPTKDTQGPGLERLEVQTDTVIGTDHYDTLVLHLNEPMQVYKDTDNPRYTRLETGKNLLSLEVSDFTDGHASKLQDPGITRIRIPPSDPKTVYLDGPAGLLKDRKWVRVTLSADFKDPAGNSPNGAKGMMEWHD